MPKKKFLLILVLSVATVIFAVLVEERYGARFIGKFFTPEELAQTYTIPSPSPTSTPSPTPRPLTFAEMNSLYGPCINLPVLAYHHIQDMELAKTKNQQNLSVSPEIFREHLILLKNKGYNPINMTELVNFFDLGSSLPRGSALLTFDDGYDDFYTTALPILREFGFASTVFVSTGLVSNPGYLSWDQIAEARDAGVFFANHTWSHKNVEVPKETVDREISVADSQLSERGLNQPKIFAYPYGVVSDMGKATLTSLGYKLAFTTRYGRVLCEKRRLELPRVRVGNASLSNFGF